MHATHFGGRRWNDDRPCLGGRGAGHQQLPSAGDASGGEAGRVEVASLKMAWCVPGGERRKDDGEVGARLAPERQREDVVERGGRRVRGAERTKNDVDGVVRRVVEHLQPSQLGEDGIDIGAFGRGREGVRDRPAHGLRHHSMFVGVDHSSLPSWRRRRAMMLRCTSAVPP